MPFSPTDVGLPPSFSDWYPGQEAALIYAISSPTRFTIVNASTGVGKSAIAMAASSILGGRAAILTSTRLLQKQYVDGFSSMGLVRVMGQSNYPCIYLEADTNPGQKVPGCDEGPCHAGIECELRDMGCKYYDAVRLSKRKPYAAFNYSYWMHTQRFGEPGTLGQFSTLVLDEAHNSADELAEFVKIHLNYAEVRKLLHIDVPRGVSIDEWVDWAANEALRVCRLELAIAKDQVSMHRHVVAIFRKLRDLEARLTDLAAARSWQRTDAPDPPAWVPGTSTDWVIEEDKSGVTFSPVWASGYAESYLFARIPKVILLSATITDRDARYLGIPAAELSYKSFASPFHKSIRPIIVAPGASVGRNMSEGETRQWINKMDAIIDFEGSVKGIIHSVSYRYAELIENRSRYSDRMIVPKYVWGRRDVRGAVERFKASANDSGAILVAPSVETGYDFPDDLARYQIIAKIPFIDNRPAVIKARAKADRRYLDHVAMTRLIQMAGRGVRSATDFCRTYIIDENWSRWFYPRNKDLVPRWFRSAIVRVRSLAELTRRAS